MHFSNRFELSIILCLISAFGVIANISTELTRVSSLCYEDAERLVRTPYGYRCVVTKGPEKRSATDLAFSTIGLRSLQSRSEPKSETQKPILSEEEFLIQDLNSIRTTPKPSVEPSVEPKYRKVMIKNNRGPWKIANMFLKRSRSHSIDDKLDKTDPQKDIILDNHLGKGQKKDGLFVNNLMVNDSVVGPKTPSHGMKITETIIPLTPEMSVEQKFIKNLPKINLFGKTVDKNKLRNFRISSDIDVIDLMEEDSISKQHIDDSYSSASDVRRTRSPIHASDDTSDHNKSDDNFSPIKIFVFLNRNRNRPTEQLTDSSNNWINVAPKPRGRINYVVTLPSSTTTTTSTTTSTTTTSTTTPAPTTTTTTTTTMSPIKRVLKKFDLNEFDGTIASDVLKDIEEREEEDRYAEPATETVEDTFTLTPYPISRNWTFICGKRKGFYADVDNDCRTYYQCSVRGRQRWECPPGTRFNQFSSTCDWMENVNCLAFKDLINDKIVVEQTIDQTTTASPLVQESDTSTSTITTYYEPEYEDSWE